MAAMAAFQAADARRAPIAVFCGRGFHFDGHTRVPIMGRGYRSHSSRTYGPSIGTPMIVSLVSLPTLATASHDGLDREAVSAMPQAQPAQRSQSSPERSPIAERKAEVESVVTSKSQGVPGSEAPRINLS